jgi:ribosomal protein S18 acetylase RimI-like enzyme
LFCCKLKDKKEKKMDLINMHEASKEVLKKCAQLYCLIWMESPWNEYFWTTDKVINDINEQMKFPLSQGFVAIRHRKPYNYECLDLCGADATGYSEEDLKEPVGFTWGYEVNIPDISKISGISETRWKKVTGGKRMFYVDELGVQEDYREMGVGKKLTEKLLKQMPSLGVSYVALRTDLKAQAARILYQKLGFREIEIADSKYPDRTYWLLSI